MTTDDPFHEGEHQIQQRTGERDIAERHGRLISPSLTPSMCDFLARQYQVAVAALDAHGQLHASVWLGDQGFIHACAEDRINIVLDNLGVSYDDPVLKLFKTELPVGLLAIDLETRRRLRINGVIDVTNTDRVVIVTREVFPNCPKYIQKREARASIGQTSAHSPMVPCERGDQLDHLRCAQIERADTLFVASCHPTRGVDISHRGGTPGFVHIIDPNTLRLPDYPGNSMFQTLGNLSVDPRAAITVIDFVRNRQLCMTGTTTLEFGDEDPTHPTKGTQRYWRFMLDAWADIPLNKNWTWQLIEPSPFNPLPSIDAKNHHRSI